MTFPESREIAPGWIRPESRATAPAGIRLESREIAPGNDAPDNLEIAPGTRSATYTPSLRQARTQTPGRSAKC